MRIVTTLTLLAAIIGGIVATAGTADAYNCTSYRSGNYTYTNCN
jgi:hypothetical protein